MNEVKKRMTKVMDGIRIRKLEKELSEARMSQIATNKLNKELEKDLLIYKGKISQINDEENAKRMIKVMNELTQKKYVKQEEEDAKRMTEVMNELHQKKYNLLKEQYSELEKKYADLTQTSFRHELLTMVAKNELRDFKKGEEFTLGAIQSHRKFPDNYSTMTQDEKDDDLEKFLESTKDDLVKSRKLHYFCEVIYDDILYNDYNDSNDSLVEKAKDYIVKAKEVHGDLYDYSKTNYTEYKEMLTFICDKHGEFQQRSDNHLQGKGCYKCGFEKTLLAKKKVVNPSKTVAVKPKVKIKEEIKPLEVEVIQGIGDDEIRPDFLDFLNEINN